MIRFGTTAAKSVVRLLQMGKRKSLGLEDSALKRGKSSLAVEDPERWQFISQITAWLLDSSIVITLQCFVRLCSASVSGLFTRVLRFRNEVVANGGIDKYLTAKMPDEARSFAQTQICHMPPHCL